MRDLIVCLRLLSGRRDSERERKGSEQRWKERKKTEKMEVGKEATGIMFHLTILPHMINSHTEMGSMDMEDTLLVKY